MKRTQLYYKDMAEIVGSDGFSVVRLTDADEQRVLCVICDRAMTEQMNIRFKRLPATNLLLPEVLVSMILSEGEGVVDFELMVYDVIDGKYRVTLLNKRTSALRPIRISDAVLLHYISRIPFYIEEGLMAKQSTRFDAETTNVNIPINTLDTERLRSELDRAVSDENYRLASYLHEELQKRGKG